MPLNIELRNGAGRVMRRAGESPPRKLLPLPSPDDSRFPLLRGVDPYGDTVFSSTQMRSLVPELEALWTQARTGERALVDEILEMARTCWKGPHRTLVFIGD